MKAIVLGAGRIGRGFVTQILKHNDIEVVHFDNSQTLVELMNKEKTYAIHVMGYPELNMRVEDVRAYHISDIDALAKEWHDADYLFTAVGGANLSDLGIVLAQAFANTDAYKISNIITCENWVDPAADVYKAILEHLDESQKNVFNHYVGVSEAAILTTGAGAPEGEEVQNPVDTWVQNFLYLPIDREHIKGALHSLKHVEYEENFADFLKQKLYTNNTSVATIAYLGYLKGYKYVADAANDREIEPILDAAYDEINQALIKGLAINDVKQYAFAKRAKEKYQDRNIIDLITRIARDPIRKLRPEDRLLGPSRIALSVAVTPIAIAMALIAALYYDYPEDEGAVAVSDYRKQHGIIQALRYYSDLQEDDALIPVLKEASERLVALGWLQAEEVVW